MQYRAQDGDRSQIPKDSRTATVRKPDNAQKISAGVPNAGPIKSVGLDMAMTGSQTKIGAEDREMTTNIRKRDTMKKQIKIAIQKFRRRIVWGSGWGGWGVVGGGGAVGVGFGLLGGGGWGGEWYPPFWGTSR